jgi:hypothetical protein
LIEAPIAVPFGQFDMAGRRGDVMRLLIAVVAVLVLCGCAAQNEISKRQREAESNAPDLSFQGPLRPMNLSAAQIKLDSRASPEI